MQSLRASLQCHHGLALLLVVVALCVKAMVPSGFMVGQQSRTLTIVTCHDSQGEPAVRQLVIPWKGDAGDPSGRQAKGECPFTALSMASLSGADAPLPAVAFVIVMTLGLAPVTYLLVDRIPFLRPPLRGPPAFA